MVKDHPFLIEKDRSTVLEIVSRERTFRGKGFLIKDKGFAFRLRVITFKKVIEALLSIISWADRLFNYNIAILNLNNICENSKDNKAEFIIKDFRY